jgi:hypothetical protein
MVVVKIVSSVLFVVVVSCIDDEEGDGGGVKIDDLLKRRNCCHIRKDVTTIVDAAILNPIHDDDDGVNDEVTIINIFSRLVSFRLIIYKVYI